MGCKKTVSFSGGFKARGEALKVARRLKGLKKNRDAKLTVPKRRREGFYRIRYEY